MTETRYRLPNEVAAQLQLSPSTLRRWSNEFAEFLSDTGGRSQSDAAGQVSHRRYTDQDLETLMVIRGLLAEGLTYVQVAKRLEAMHLRQTATDLFPEEDGSQVTVLGPSLQPSSTLFPAVTVLADTLHTVANGQQMLLGSQQANRDLLTVVLQDNFTLKEENTKLRDRMLELERDLAEIRRLDSTRRETLDARMQELEQQIRQRAHQAKPAERAQRSGCLGQILGLVP